MTLTVRFTLNNAAFEGAGRGSEAARILRQVADVIEENALDETRVVGPALDINGNAVGSILVED